MRDSDDTTGDVEEDDLWRLESTGRRVHYDPVTETFRTAHRLGDAASLVTTFVETVAVATDTDPEALPSLADRVDPGALERLFRPRDRPGQARGRFGFPFGDVHVAVHADGEITARLREEGSARVHHGKSHGDRRHDPALGSDEAPERPAGTDRVSPARTPRLR